ncbi:hypothetical protein ACYULU_08655 [Breznakiellaceae bacterium SP9]
MPDNESISKLLDILDHASTDNGIDKAIAILEQRIATPSPELVAKTPRVEFQQIEAIVAFIDVLGTSALMNSIKSANADVTEITETILGIKKLFQVKCEGLKAQIPKINWMFISDSFVISVPKETEAFFYLVKLLAECQYECLVNHSQILRGAISVGPIIGGDFEENIIIGPAFIDAHSLEGQVAIFPRIVVDNRIDKSLYPQKEKLPIVLDKDGVQYIDFMASTEADMNRVTEKAQAGCSEVGDDMKKLQKWNWLQTFLEQKKNGRLYCCKSSPVEVTNLS